MYLFSSAEGARAAVVGLHAASDEAASRACAVCVGVYVFVRPKYMCTYYQVPKAREQWSSDCKRLEAKPLAASVRGCLCIC